MIKHIQHANSTEVCKQVGNLRKDSYFGYKNLSKISHFKIIQIQNKEWTKDKEIKSYPCNFLCRQLF